MQNSMAQSPSGFRSAMLDPFLVQRPWTSGFVPVPRIIRDRKAIERWAMEDVRDAPWHNIGFVGDEREWYHSAQATTEGVAMQRSTSGTKRKSEQSCPSQHGGCKRVSQNGTRNQHVI